MLLGCLGSVGCDCMTLGMMIKGVGSQVVFALSLLLRGRGMEEDGGPGCHGVVQWC